MKQEKKYYWLKLKNTYFNQLIQKKMKRQPNGKDMQIIYLRMMLLSLDKDGMIYYQGVYDSIEEELAEEFDEPVKSIEETISFLIDNKIIDFDDTNRTLSLPEARECTGGETATAERMRRSRARQKERDNAMSTRNNVTAMLQTVTDCYTETETETDIYLDTDTEQADAVSADRPAVAAADGSAAPQSGDLFSVEQLMETVKRNKVGLTTDGVKAFYEEMQNSSWILYGKPVEKKGIVKSLRGYAKYHPEYAPKPIIRNSTIKKALDHIPKNLVDKGGWGKYIPQYCPKEIFTAEELDYLENEMCLSFVDVE